MRPELPSRLAPMLGLRAHYGALAALACALTLGACGGSDDEGSIPKAKGAQWISQLESIEEAVAAGECDAAEQAADALAADVRTVAAAEPDSVVREALVEATTNLTELTREDCEPETGATGDTGPITTETTTPEETTTTPPIEEEVPPPEPEEGEEEDEEPAPGGGAGQGGGGSGGGGGGSQSGGVGPED